MKSQSAAARPQTGKSAPCAAMSFYPAETMKTKEDRLPAAFFCFGGPSRARTLDRPVMSRLL